MLLATSCQQISNHESVSILSSWNESEHELILPTRSRRGDFDCRYRLRQMLGERGYRGCLAQNPKSSCSFLRTGYPESSRQLSRHRSIDKSRLKLGRYNRQTRMYEALVETLEMV